jgi:hypothetical protein
MLYKVRITEVRETIVFVDVDYDFQATTQAEKMYNDGTIRCYDEDICGVSFQLEDYDECD